MILQMEFAHGGYAWV